MLSSKTKTPYEMTKLMKFIRVLFPSSRSSRTCRPGEMLAFPAPPGRHVLEDRLFAEIELHDRRHVAVKRLRSEARRVGKQYVVRGSRVRGVPDRRARCMNRHDSHVEH